MICAYPWKSTYGSRLPCGQCMPCRINAQRKKVGRMVLEARGHAHSSFVTLTYDDEEVPRTDDGSGTLRPKDLRCFFKRLRRRIGGFRYFAAGEYGTHTWRPHYHAILFGVPVVELVEKDLLVETWGLGYVTQAEANYSRMAYTAQYTTKKLTKREDMSLTLGEREPEFSRASRRPGLGAYQIPYLAEFFMSKEGAEYIAEYGDVPRVFQMDGRTWPLDSYLVRKLRLELGMPEKLQDREQVVVDETEPPTAEEERQARLRHEKILRRARSHGQI